MPTLVTSVRLFQGDTERVLLGFSPSGPAVRRSDRAGGQRDLPANEHRLPADARQVSLRLQPPRPVEMRPGSAALCLSVCLRVRRWSLEIRLNSWSRSVLFVHGQVTIIFVVSLGFSACLFVCLFVQSFSQPSLIRFRSN